MMIEYIINSRGWLNTSHDLVLISNTDALESGGTASNTEKAYLEGVSSADFNTLQIDAATTVTIGGNFEDGNVTYIGGEMQYAVQAIEYKSSGGTLYIAAQSGAISEESKATDDAIIITAESSYASAADNGNSYIEGYILSQIDSSAYAVKAVGVINVKGTLAGTFNATANSALSYYMLDTGDELEATGQYDNNTSVTAAIYSSFSTSSSAKIVIENGSDAILNSETAFSIILDTEPEGAENISGNTVQSFGLYSSFVNAEELEALLDALELDEDEVDLDSLKSHLTSADGVFAGTINSTVHDVTLSYNMSGQENDVFVKFGDDEEGETTDPEGETTEPGDGTIIDPDGGTTLPDTGDGTEGEDLSDESTEEEEEPDYSTTFTISNNTIGSYGVAAQIITFNSFAATMNLETTNVNIEAGLSALDDDSFTMLSDNYVESIGIDGNKLYITESYTGETNITLRNVAFEIFDISGYKFANGNEVNAAGIRMDEDGSGYIYADGNMAGAINIALSDINMVDNLYPSSYDTYILNASGIYAANSLYVSGGFNTDITITSYNVNNMSSYSYVVGIYSSSINMQYFDGSITITQDFDFESSEAITIGGMVVGIWAENTLTNDNDGIVDITGNITIESYNDNAAIMGGADSGLNLRISGSIIATGWAIFAGDYDDSTRYNTNDNVTVAAGGYVFGIVELFNGTNSFTIDSNAQIVGSVSSTYGTLNLTFELNSDTFTGELAEDGSAIMYLAGDEYMLASTTTITVDLTDVAVGTEYILVQEDDTYGYTFEWDKWASREISVVYQGTTISMVLGQDYSDSNFTISTVIDSENGTISFTVESLEGEVSYAAPTGCTSESATFKDTEEDYILLSWDAVSNASTYILEYSIDGGNTIEVEISGKYSYFELTDVEDGSTVEWRVRCVTASNQTTEWSDVKSYYEDYADSSITGLDSTEFATDGEGGSAVVQVEWIAPTSEYPIVAYEIRYVSTKDNVEIDWDNLTEDDYTTKIVTGTSAIISGLNNMDYVNWQVRAIDSTGATTDWNDCNGDTFRVYVGDTEAPEFDMTSVVASVKFDSTKEADKMMSVTLSWAAAVDEDGKSGLFGYILSYREVDSDGNAIGDWKIINLAADVTSWSSGDLANGIYEWKICATDYAGNISEEYTGMNWEGDFNAPYFSNGENLESEVVADGNGDNIVSLSWGKATDSYSGTSSSGVKSYTLYIKTADVYDEDGNISIPGTVLEEIELGSDVTSYELSCDEYDLSNGNYSWYVEVEDNAGNTASSSSSNFSVDTVAPVGGLDGIQEAPVISVTWTTNTKTNPNGTTTTTYEVDDLSISMTFDGVYSDTNDIIYVLQICSDNKFSSGVVEYEFDFTPGEETLVVGSNTLYYGSDTIVFGDSSADFSVGSLLSMGETAYYRITVKDSVGNTNSTWYYYSIDLVDPETGMTITSTSTPAFPDGVTLTSEYVDETVTFSWTAADDSLGVEYYIIEFTGINGTTGSYTVCSDLEATSYSSATLTEGEYSWNVTAVNWSGATSTTSSSGYVVIDRTAPEFDTTSINATVVVNDLCVYWSWAEDNVEVAGYIVHVSTYDSVTGGYLAWAEYYVSSETNVYWMYNLSGSSVAYQVCAVDTNGNYTDWSDIKYATINSSTEAGTTFDTAEKLAWGSTGEYSVGGADTIDMYKISIASSGSATITISDVSGLIVANDGINIVVYNEDGTVITSSYATGYGADKVITIDLDIANGSNYYIKVTPGSSDTDTNIVNYTISTDIAYVVPVTTVDTVVGNGVCISVLSDGSLVTTTSNSKVTVGVIDVDAWTMLSTGDFNGNGSDGVLWLENATGNVYVQNDLTSVDEITNKSNLLGVVTDDYKLVATGDFIGSGVDGALLLSPAFGDSSVSTNYGLAVWTVGEDGTMQAGWLGALVNTWETGDALKGDYDSLTDEERLVEINASNYSYELTAVGDFNGDGVDDVMIQNTMPTTVDGETITGSGDVFVFLTDTAENVFAGERPEEGIVYTGCASDGWEILGVGDFNGDGVDDVLLTDGTSLAGWEMSDGQRVSDYLFGDLEDGYSVIGIADFNDDGIDDIVISDSDNNLTVWTVKDGVVSGTISLA